MDCLKVIVLNIIICTFNTSGETIDQFPSFLEIFIPCTMHIIRNKDRLKTDSEFVDKLAHLSSVNLQTAEDIPNKIDGYSFTTFWLVFNFDFGNLSQSFHKLFLLKYQNPCTIDAFMFELIQNPTDVCNSLELLLVHKQNESNRRKIQLYQPDFILVALATTASSTGPWYLPVRPYTRSKIMLLDLSSNSIYFANVILEDQYQRKMDLIRGLVIISVPVFRFNDKIRHTKSVKQLSLVFDQFYYTKSNDWSTTRTIAGKNNVRLYGWVAYVLELTLLGLNCTTEICFYVVRSEFGKMEAKYFKKQYYPISHGTEFYGIQYFLVYSPDMERNMYALLAPFSFVGWSLILISFGLVGLILFLQGVSYNPLFWLFSVVLEQGDHKRCKTNNVSWVLLFVWLYVALLLRNFYTSNLYTYMTVELGPSDLPNSLSDILNSPSVPLLATSSADSLVSDYIWAINKHGLKHTNLYHLAKRADQKTWSLYHFDPVNHFRYNTRSNIREICRISITSLVDKSCVQLKRLALISENGPLDGIHFGQSRLGKLLLMLNNSRFEMLENNDRSLFRVGKLLYSFSNNFLLPTVNMHLSLLVQAGIDEVLKKQEMELKMKSFADRLNNNGVLLARYNISLQIMSKYISKWVHKGCFILYREEVCSLKNQKYLEVPVKLVDLTTAWLLFIGLLLLSIVGLLYEIVRT